MRYLLLFICVAGIFSWFLTLTFLERYLQFLRNHSDKLVFQLISVALALVFGIALIVESENSLYPGFFTVLGTIYLSEAILLAAIGRSNLGRLVNWGLSIYKTPLGHVAGIAGVVLVGFIGYAII